MELRRNERAGETGDPRENPPKNSIVRHDFHLRKIRFLNMTCRLDSTVLCSNMAILTAHSLSAVTVEGDDCASVLQEVSNTVCTKILVLKRNEEKFLCERLRPYKYCSDPVASSLGRGVLAECRARRQVRTTTGDSEMTVSMGERTLNPTSEVYCASLERAKRFGRLLTARSREPRRVIEVSMERRRNETAREMGEPREYPPNSGIVRHDSHPPVTVASHFSEALLKFYSVDIPPSQQTKLHQRAPRQTEFNTRLNTPYFRKWESCRTMPLVGGFSRGFPVSPATSFRRAPYLLQLTSSALKTSLLRAAQISSLTHSLTTPKEQRTAFVRNKCNKGVLPQKLSYGDVFLPGVCSIFLPTVRFLQTTKSEHTHALGPASWRWSRGRPTHLLEIGHPLRAEYARMFASRGSWSCRRVSRSDYEQEARTSSQARPPQHCPGLPASRTAQGTRVTSRPANGAPPLLGAAQSPPSHPPSPLPDTTIHNRRAPSTHQALIRAKTSKTRRTHYRCRPDSFPRATIPHRTGN
ncbi:hypothetical protein PR048_012502 [Dryococelus australis]|uniref:Uncharacterized protein n=1 Tax=Dryococelus australis TaxID=614101 RepID=A0ABQ9HPJ5_9NEOP|nr:hypothetical protein PR048_012502 [Dryococelus australis]